MSNVLSILSRPRSFHHRHLTLFQSQCRDDLSSAANVSTRERVAQEMHEIVRMAGEDGGSVVKGCILLASRRLNLPFVKTRKIWYREPCTIWAHEADALRAARGRILELQARRLQAQLDVVHARMRAAGGEAEGKVA